MTFDRGGKTYRLQAARVKGGSLWFVFRDATSGRTTHGGDRQLTTVLEGTLALEELACSRAA